ncbi:hypothetical protein PI124_g19274 [Phytophthora idaei]|nr:hypothetical protein PI125_g20307 [Phytophthora idaei]KAG3135272.1 hypothetical protein PI126_g18318 [Phytophthora idaei]KAG3235696.1 hypothetical protein PI124_g19274 [Phytophthora idaei]
MVVKYADGKPRRLPRRSVTFSYEFDGFTDSDEFLVNELNGAFDCVFGIPWLARHQPHIDGFTGTARPRDIDVNAVLAFLSGMPNLWPHVTVMDPDSMTTLVPEVSDGPSCAACARAACAGPELESQDTCGAVEQGFPRPDEQWLTSEGDVVERDLPHAVEQGFPRVVERELPSDEDDVVERGLLQAVEHGLSCVVELELPESDASELCYLHLGTDVESRRPNPADMTEHGLSSPAVDDATRLVRRRGPRNPRRPCAPSRVSAKAQSEVIFRL